MLIQFQPPAMCRVANQQPRLPRATSSLALNACRDGASTASLGNPFSASPPSICLQNLDEEKQLLYDFPWTNVGKLVFVVSAEPRTAGLVYGVVLRRG